MSTALVSAFYDVGDILYQNRMITLDSNQKAVGSPLHSTSRHSSSSALRSSPVSMRITRPNSPMISETSTFTALLAARDHTLSNNTFTQQQHVTHQVQQQQQAQFHRKLDRTFSEPGPCPTAQISVDNNNAQDAINLNNNANTSNNVNQNRYKTEMCRPFEESGHCKYGDKCQFAHGAHELRTINRHPKFKTELCRTFHTVGFCPYGPRCHFIHSDGERKANQMNNVKASSTQNQSSTAFQPTGHHGMPNMIRAQPTQQRPKALSFSSYHLPLALGSCADSPPSSINSDSPSLSPVFFDEPTTFGTSQPQVLHTAPPCTNATSKFRFPSTVPSPTTAPVPTPFEIHVRQLLKNIDTGLVSETHYNVFSSALTPSPPNSLCGDTAIGSPLDISKNLRLPIFSQLSIQDDF